MDGTAFRGLWGFPLTPFRSDGIDRAILAASADRLVEAGLDVVCAAGAIGQGDRMTGAERIDCLRVVTEAVAGRRPVLATVVADDDATTTAREAQRVGAAGILLLPTSGDAEEMVAGLRRSGSPRIRPSPSSSTSEPRCA